MGLRYLYSGLIAWIADGVLEAKTSLVVQNAVLLLINVLGYGAGCRAPARKPAPPKTEAQSVRPVSCQR